MNNLKVTIDFGLMPNDQIENEIIKNLDKLYYSILDNSVENKIKGSNYYQNYRDKFIVDVINVKDSYFSLLKFYITNEIYQTLGSYSSVNAKDISNTVVQFEARSPRHFDLLELAEVLDQFGKQYVNDNKYKLINTNNINSLLADVLEVNIRKTDIQSLKDAYRQLKINTNTIQQKPMNIVAFEIY